MQTRTITVDYARPRGYDVGYRAENNFTELLLPVPAELENADSYRVYFESTVGEYLQTGLLTPVDGYVAVKITSDVVPEPGNMAAQLVAFADGEIVGYAPMITGSAKVSIPDGTERLLHSLVAEIALNTAARHGHDNKPVIDLLTADDTGTLLYDGKVIGGGASDFIIKMTVTSDDNGKYTVTSCSTTVEQIDAAVADEKRVVVIATDTDNNLSWDIPIVQGFNGSNYYFATFLLGQAILSFVQKVGENQARWQFIVGQIGADFISYSNDALPNMSTVGEALDELVTKSPVYYIDLAGTYPNYTCPVSMDDIKAAYNSGYNLVCRCTLGKYTATLPLFVPMPAANTWIFSGSGCLQSMKFEAQSFTVAITANGVVAQNKELVTFGGTLPNPYELQITVGNTAYLYDGSERVNIVIDDGTEVSY